MSKFKRPKPRFEEDRSVDATAVAAFAGQAGPARSEPVRAATPVGPGLDRNGPRVTGVNVRLNAYELELLRELARREDRSIQQVVRRRLIPLVEKEVKP